MEPDGQLWLETITQTGNYINSIKSLSTLIKNSLNRGLLTHLSSEIFLFYSHC